MLKFAVKLLIYFLIACLLMYMTIQYPDDMLVFCKAIFGGVERIAVKLYNVTIPLLDSIRAKLNPAEALPSPEEEPIEIELPESPVTPEVEPRHPMIRRPPETA